MPEVLLTVDGKKHGGWKTVNVSSSLRQLAATFSLSFSDRWPGQQEKYSIKRGSRCTVSLDGVVVLDGWVDTLSVAYDDSSHSLNVSGRDLCCDLVDCSHTGTRVDFAGETLLAMATELCEPFGVQVQAETEIKGQLPQARYGQGDSVHDFLLRLCRLKGVLPVSRGDGILRLTTAGTSHCGATLKQGEGGNIKAGSGDLSAAERYSQYIVKGQGQAPAQFDWPAEEGEDAEEHFNDRASFISPRGQAEDPLITRYRPLVILAEAGGDQAQMQARARWEAVNRAGQGEAMSYVVQGWGPSAGQIWRINQLVTVDDPLGGISGQQLIEGVSLSYSESGSTTTLSVVHPDAYALQPKANQAGKVTSKWDWS